MGNENEISVNRTYSVSLRHIGLVADLALQFGVAQGAVVRSAIDLLNAAVERGEVTVAGGLLVVTEPKNTTG